jgi:hypothetical protein
MTNLFHCHGVFCYHELNIVTIFIEISLKRSMLYEIIKVFFYQLPWVQKWKNPTFFYVPISFWRIVLSIFSLKEFIFFIWNKPSDIVHQNGFVLLLYTVHSLKVSTNHKWMNNTCTCIYNMVGIDYFDFMVNEKGKTKFV